MSTCSLFRRHSLCTSQAQMLPDNTPVYLITPYRICKSYQTLCSIYQQQKMGLVLLLMMHCLFLTQIVKHKYMYEGDIDTCKCDYQVAQTGEQRHLTAQRGNLRTLTALKVQTQSSHSFREQMHTPNQIKTKYRTFTAQKKLSIEPTLLRES